MTEVGLLRLLLVERPGQGGGLAAERCLQVE